MRKRYKRIPKRHTKSKLKSGRRLIFVSIFIFLFILGILYHFQLQSNIISPLPRLPIPKNALVYFPSPLRMSPFSYAVLGAETIDGSDIVYYVNLERQKAGALPLAINSLLVEGAERRAEVILKYQNFSHQDPYEGVELGTVLPSLNYYFKYASENIGMGGTSAKNFVYGFMNSTSHRENLLNPDLAESGVAVVTGPYKEYYVNIAVQLFAVPATKEEYLGYSKKDIKNYEDLIRQIDEKIAFTEGFLEKEIGSQTYYSGWKELLQRQKGILATLLIKMRGEEPFNQDSFTLLGEYNSNWNKAPRYEGS